MGNWKGIVGSSFSAEGFDSYCHALHWTQWRPSFIVLHNTAIPSLAQRPDGLTRQHIANLEGFYRDKQKWSAGPHLFIDDRQIWVFTPLTVSGTHSPSFNKIALGIEMLGDFATEPFTDTRGLNVRNNAVAAVATLCAGLGLDPDTLRLHKEDPRTTHNCPGRNVDKAMFIEDVKALMRERHSGEHPLVSQTQQATAGEASGAHFPSSFQVPRISTMVGT